MLLESPVYAGADARRPEYKACALAYLQYFADSLATAAADTQSGEVRKAAIHAMKEVSLSVYIYYIGHNSGPLLIYVICYMMIYRELSATLQLVQDSCSASSHL